MPENIRDPRPEELLPDVQRMQEAFVGLCRDAAAHGTANVRTLEAGRAIVEGANQPNGLIFGIWRAGGIDYKEISNIPRRFIGSIELDDAGTEVVGSLWDHTIHRRLLPGEGALDVPSFIGAVKSADYKGP